MSYTRPSFSVKGAEITPIIGFSQFMRAIQDNPTCMLLTIAVYAYLHLEDGTEDEEMESVCYYFLADLLSLSLLNSYLPSKATRPIYSLLYLCILIQRGE